MSTIVPVGPQVYPAHPLYRVGALVSALGVALFGWQLLEAARSSADPGIEVGALLFLGISAFLLIHFARLTAARVIVDDAGVTLRLPGSTPRTVAFRQLSQVHEDGRGLRSIVLLYHPRDERGLIETDDLASLALPAVARQDDLLATLQERVVP